MKNRAKTVLILGAGATFPLGFPVTSGLLPRAMRKLAEKQLFKDINSRRHEKEDMVFLYKTLRKLLPGWGQKFPDEDLPLITEVLSLVDYSIAEGKPLFPRLTHEETLRVRDLLGRSIFEVLGDGDRLNAGQKRIRESYCNWIWDRTGDGLGVITTNYDTCIEQRLFNMSREDGTRVHNSFDFGFAWLDTETKTRTLRLRPPRPALRWFKLHGSLNWARCPACEHIYINPYGNIAFQAYRRTVDEYNSCHCGRAARLQTHLVAPSMYRTVRDANLLKVWKSSMQLLLEADSWIIIGYSLPGEDIAIRSMLARAYHAADRKTKITIVQPNNNVESKYRLLFKDCVYENCGVEGWLARH